MKHNPAFLPGLMFVLAVHGALLYYLFKQQLIPPPQQLATLMVNFIPSFQPKEESKPEPPPPLPKPQPPKKPKSQQLVAEKPVVAESERVAPPSLPEPEPEPAPEPVAEVAPPQMPPGPVTLSSELSVVCPERNAPAYPALSRRLGEEGKLMLQVELDEKGHVNVLQVIDSSGFKRLDEAAKAAVKTWRCNPYMRDGQPTRVTAQQHFNFILQGD
ncbi:outer membrane transport energization protein TonB [Nitrosospira sp. Nsp18]|uniref:energy transducer TonB n=1 Tax=Nitrosospira sp. Nsp18 TaxID=1855334 RepID=UPI0008890E3F|nr:energy transducer TonB [Nitrosospira sp. Nsp18]SDA26767.1 outer membrane transport energization protein TonB [Nitrosospira sp. Nsp18]